MKKKIFLRFFITPLLMVAFIAPPFATVALAQGDPSMDLDSNAHAGAAPAPNAGSAAGGAAAGGAAACLAPAFAYVGAWLVLWLAGFLTELKLMPQTAAGWAQGANDTLNTGMNWSAVIKDCILDPIAWGLVNLALQQMLHSIAVWVASGFEGGPTFITNPEQFFLDVANILAGEMIFGGALRVLCSPFQLQLQLNILLRFFGPPSEEKNFCRLTEVVSNVHDFLDGSFDDGGWPAWFTVAIQPRQNLWDAMIGVEGDMALSIRSRTGTLDWQIANGSGFYGILDKAKNWVAPGEYVQASVNEAFFSGKKRLEIADEIDEVVGALFKLIFQEVLGPGGLLGPKEPKYDRGDGVMVSYLDLLDAESNPTNQKEQLLTQIDTLLLEAGANPIYADQIAKLTELREKVEAVDPNTTNASYLLGNYSSEVAQIAVRMGMSEHMQNMENIERPSQEDQGVEGPTPPPTNEETQFPIDTPPDPSGNPTNTGPNVPGDIPETPQTPTDNGDLLPPPPPPPLP